MEVYNAKAESISGVIVTPITDVQVSPTQYFIGSMDPDDVFSASFDVYTSDLEIGNSYDIDFKVTFKQGENYYETSTVGTSFSVTEPVDSNAGLTNNLALIFISIVLIIVNLLYFIRKKRRIFK